MELSEEDQMLQAIAMSLGENVQVSGGSSVPPGSSLSGSTAVALTPVKPAAPSPPKELDDDPLPKGTLDEFTDNVLEGCLGQLDAQSQMVYKVCELLTTCVTRNGEAWRDKMLTTLVNQMSEQAKQLTQIAGTSLSPENVEKLCSSELATKFAVRLHLVTLLFEEMKSGCARAMEHSNLLDTLTELFTLTHANMAANPRPPSPVIAVPQIPNTKEKEKDKTKDKNSKDKEGGEKETTDGPLTPKWLSPGLLILDLYEKLSIATKRKQAVQKICNNVWKWFDMSTLKWCAYSPGNNKTINDSYWAGDSSVRIINGRRKYAIQFHSMVQVNEESGNRRPIMITINEKVISEHKKKLTKDDPTPSNTDDLKESKSKSGTEVTTESCKKEAATTDVTTESSNAAFDLSGDVEPGVPDEKMECEDGEDNQTTTESSVEGGSLEAADAPSTQLPIVDGLTIVHKDTMIRACVGFMKLGVDPDTLHALMRLCLRITRSWEQACQFASLGGVRTLLSLTESCAFWGFHNLAALLMRHVMEEPQTLRYTMEKVVRSTASNNTMSGAKELHYLLRVLAPAACRDPELFTEITQQTLRIDLNMTLKRNLMSANSEDSILMKSVGGKGGLGSTGSSSTSNTQGSSSSQPSSGVSSEPQQLIHDLLEALTSLNEDDLNSASSTNTAAAGATSTSASTPTEERNAAVGVGAAGARRQLHLSRSSSANDMVVQETEEQSPMESESSKVPGSGDGKSSPGADKAADEAAKKKKPLMSKSMICKLLAEFVRSYAGCAKLVTEHHYVAGTNERITEDCSALAYMLDHLVCSNSSYEKDTAGHVRVLIAALSSCNHAPEAQTILVTEVKGALGRATILTESPEKHGKVQALVGLICTMMEACPAQLNQPPNLCFKQQQLGMNNMIRVMVRKGLVTDMARIPHSLDFSSPNMATTINAALKPLELVSRIVNLPSFVPVSSSKKKNPSTTVEESAAALGTGTTNSEATRAQGDDNTEDAENTEHDISVAGESLEPTSDAHPNE
ncbi:unnamed protein product, partial [Meganyctiphanes norvegica]